MMSRSLPRPTARRLVASCVAVATVTTALGLGATAAQAAPAPAAPASSPAASSPAAAAPGAAAPAARLNAPTVESVIDHDDSWPSREIGYIFAGGTPGSALRLTNTTTGESGAWTYVDDGGRASAVIDVEGGKLNELVLTVAESYGSSNTLEVPLSFDDRHEAPAKPTRVTSTVSGPVTTLHVEGDSDAVVVVYDASGRLAAVGGRLVDGKADVALATPYRESLYRVALTTKDAESEAVDVVLQAGVGTATPSAPTVLKATRAGSSVVADVAGEAGSTLSVKTTDGKTVAVRVVAKNGRAQVVVPATAVDAGASIVQQSGGATSAATALEVTP